MAEMFNILGFHCSLKSDILKKFYGRSKDKEHERKENLFYNNEAPDLLLNLTERDFRTIMKLKEELSQVKHFKPLLPDHKRHRYYHSCLINQK